jgi:hypothetical protein
MLNSSEQFFLHLFEDSVLFLWSLSYCERLNQVVPIAITFLKTLGFVSPARITRLASSFFTHFSQLIGSTLKADSATNPFTNLRNLLNGSDMHMYTNILKQLHKACAFVFIFPFLVLNDFDLDVTKYDTFWSKYMVKHAQHLSVDWIVNGADALLYFLEGGYQVYKFGDFSIMRDPTSYIGWGHELYNLTEESSKVDKTDGDAIQAHIVKFQLLHRKGMEMRLQMRNSKISMQDRQFFNQDMKLIEKTIESLRRQFMVTGTRIPPFTIHFHGVPEIGKSNLIYLMVALASKVNPQISTDLSSIYQIPTKTETLDGYYPEMHTTCVMDDPNAVHEKVAIDKNFLDLHKFVNSYIYETAQADLPRKGLVPFLAKLLIITSNDKTANSNRYFRDPASAIRRLGLSVEMILKEEYTKDGKLDASQVKWDDWATYPWLFTISEYITKERTFEVISSQCDISEMCTIVEQYMNTHWRRGKEMQHTTEYLIKMGCCVHGCLKSMCKLCLPELNAQAMHLDKSVYDDSPDPFLLTCTEKEWLTYIYDSNYFCAREATHFVMVLSVMMWPFLLVFSFMSWDFLFEWSALSPIVRPYKHRKIGRSFYNSYGRYPSVVELINLERMSGTVLEMFLRDNVKAIRYLDSKIDFVRYFRMGQDEEMLGIGPKVLKILSSSVILISLLKKLFDYKKVHDSYVPLDDAYEDLGDDAKPSWEEEIIPFKTYHFSRTAMQPISDVCRNMCFVYTTNKFLASGGNMAINIAPHLFVTTGHTVKTGDLQLCFAKNSVSIPFTRKSVYMLPHRDIAFIYLPEAAPRKDISGALLEDFLSAEVFYEGFTVLGNPRGKGLRSENGSLERPCSFKLTPKVGVSGANDMLFTDLYVSNCKAGIAGDCGSPLFVTNGKSSALVGICESVHQGVTTNFAPICKKDVDEALKYFEATPKQVIAAYDTSIFIAQMGPIQPLYKNSSFRWLEGDFNVIGTLKSHESTMKSQFIKTPWHSIFTKAVPELNDYVIPTFKTVDGSVRSHDQKPRNVALAKLIKPKGALPPSILRECSTEYVRRLSPVAQFDGRLSLHETINGRPGVYKSMDLSTAVGSPLRGKKHEHFHFRGGNYYPKHQILMMFAQMHAMFLAGYLYRPIFSLAYKDEIISRSKNEIGKIRAFTITSTCFNMLLRMYFLPVITFLKQQRALSCFAVGINAISEEWTEQAVRLQSMHAVGEDADFRSMDVTTAPTTILESFRILIALASLTGQYTSKDIQVMKLMAQSLAYPLIMSKGDVAEVFGCLMSGFALTVDINTLDLIMYHMVSFRIRFPHLKFFDWVQLLGYGDDVLFFSKILKGHDVCKILGAFGLEYTPAIKDSIDFIPKDIKYLTFLQRRFYKAHYRGNTAYLPALSLKSMMKKFCYYKDSNTAIGLIPQLVVNIRDLYLDSYCHPGGFEFVHRLILSLYEQFDIPIVPVPHRDNYLITKFFSTNIDETHCACGLINSPKPIFCAHLNIKMLTGY